MKSKVGLLIRATMAMFVFALFGCDRAPVTTPQDDHAEEAPVASNRVAIPSAVRSNLGITFIEVERRRIEETLRVPGRFEYLPTARREYRTAVPGRVELLVEQFDRVEAGTPLYKIDSPAWREVQQSLADSEARIEQFTARRETFEPLFAAHEKHETSLHESIDVWEERIEQLQSIREVGGGRIDELTAARASLANLRAELASIQENHATLRAEQQHTEADLRAAKSRLGYLLDSAAAIASVDRSALAETVRTDQGDKPFWANVNHIQVVAMEPGVVSDLALTNGSWADETAAVVTIVQPNRLRFRASGLQSDLGVLADGLFARIVPPTPTTAGRAVPLNETMSGTLRLGLSGDPNERTLELFMTPDDLQSWARDGVSAQLEIVTDSTATPVLAIPLAAVQQDGLSPVIFRRAPDNPNEVIRIEADLGKDDGRWVALLSGVRDGDEVVLDGAFQLMLATSGSIQKGGHFHSDGTFHEGDD